MEVSGAGRREWIAPRFAVRHPRVAGVSERGKEHVAFGEGEVLVGNVSGESGARATWHKALLLTAGARLRWGALQPCESQRAEFVGLAIEFVLTTQMVRNALLHLGQEIPTIDSQPLAEDIVHHQLVAQL